MTSENDMKGLVSLKFLRPCSSLSATLTFTHKNWERYYSSVSAPQFPDSRVGNWDCYCRSLAAAFSYQVVYAISNKSINIMWRIGRNRQLSCVKIVFVHRSKASQRLRYYCTNLPLAANVKAIGDFIHTLLEDIHTLITAPQDYELYTTWIKVGRNNMYKMYKIQCLAMLKIKCSKSANITTLTPKNIYGDNCLITKNVGFKK
jgi:hypothetical protein